MTPEIRVRDVGDITTEHLFDMVVDLHDRISIGDGPYGRRVLFAAAGGSFAGPSLHGQVLPVGGDWTLFRPDGAMSLDVRLTLRTHDGALVHMTYGGRWIVPPHLRAAVADPALRVQLDPARYYFRTNPLFETGDRRYAWLNDIVTVGSGYLVDGGIAYKIAKVR
jgi:hypothetical protein